MSFEALRRANARRYVDRAFATVGRLDQLDVEIVGLATRHLCIMCSGLLEEYVRLHVAEYARTQSRGYVAAFVSSRVSKTTNLKSEKLIALFGEFDSSLSEEVENFLDRRRKDGLNSLIALRHAVAHGRENGVSLHQITNTKIVLYEILDKLDEIFLRLSI